MNASITAHALFEQLRERLDLRWIAGQRGEARVLEAVETVARRPSLAGYLNMIYPNKVQILGTEELTWLDGLDSRLRWETIQKLTQSKPLALVLSKNQPCPDDLRGAAEESDTPLWSSPKRGHELLNHVQYHLARTLAPRVTLHGVFMEIYSIGVLITGESGAGKSELALELVSRGHGLVADDVVELSRIAPHAVEGRCPALLRDLLEVRGLGLIDIRTIFGEAAVRRKMTLKLIVHLIRRGTMDDEHQRMPLEALTEDVLGLAIPKVVIPVAAGRNLAVLTEAAVRSTILQLRGFDTTGEFLARQRRLIESS